MNKPIICYKCPKCGWLISENGYLKSRYDYGCPKDNTSFTEFKKVEINHE